MNSKSVLNRIATLLSLDKEEVMFTDAKTADGTILQSPTFDVGEKVEVVSEDGTKSLAPDGEHEISLRDTEGNEVLIKIETKDGIIVERENVELEKKMDEEVVDKDAEIEDEKDIEMADVETKEAKGLPNTTEENEANVVKEGEPSEDPIMRLGFRIDELESKLKDMMDKFTSAFPSEGMEVSSLQPNTMMEEVDEEELPKLDGAPVEQVSKFSIEQNKNNFGKKTDNLQASFLAKLYK
jgi:hypothetical protein